MKETFFIRFLNSDTEITGLTLSEARAKAEAYVGNSRATKMFPNEESYLYGPGDGTSSVMIRQEWDD